VIDQPPLENHSISMKTSEEGDSVSDHSDNGRAVGAGSDDPIVRIITDFGDILVQIHASRAPLSAGAFLAGVDAERYDNARFTRLVRADNDHGAPPVQIVQVMCAEPVEGHGEVRVETTAETGLRHEDGSISLPRLPEGPSNAQSFFLCIGAQPALDHGGGRFKDGLGGATFGRIVSGMDVARRIHGLPTREDAEVGYIKGQVPLDPILVHRIVREPADAAARLQRLAEDYWRFRLRELPAETGAMGVRTGPGVEDVKPEDFARRARLCVTMAARADQIDGVGLDEEGNTTLALLRDQLSVIIDAFGCDEHHRPRLFPLGFVSWPGFWLRAAAPNSLADRDALIARIGALPAYLSDNLASLRAGFAKGYRIPRVLVPPVLSLMDADLADDGLAVAIPAKFAPPLPGVDEAILHDQRKRASAAVAKELIPALQRVRDALASLDTASLSDDDGLWAQPGGRDYYRFKVRQQTSTDLDPDTIHEIGLDEVKRIGAAFEAVAEEMGRPGEVAAIAAELDTCVASGASALLEQVRAFAKRVDGQIPSAFGKLPRITYAVEPFTLAQSRSMPPAMAQAAPADRSRPGVFWLTALPEKMPVHLIPALTVHEAWPGHLMQFSIAHELADLPDFRRFQLLDYNAYVEGWGLYCERLGHELNVYDTPAEKFGRLSFEIWRAARLVVDTGIHWLGWNRAKAVEYLRQTCFLPLSTCESEVDRYIGMPAQALSYKLGERAIVASREAAEARLGERFSLRDFHDALLGLGPVSLTQMQKRMARWADQSLP
jgi:uncharacterized protein (DUF885 family)